MNKTHPLTHSVSLLVGYILTLIPFFLLLETLKALRSSQWTPDEFTHAPFGLGIAIYALLVLAIGASATLAFSLLGRALPRTASTIATLTAFTGTSLWLSLSHYRIEAPTLSDNHVILMILALSVVQFIALRFFRFTPINFGLCCAATLGFANVVFHTHATGHIFTPDRLNVSLRTPALFIVIFALAVGVLALVCFWNASRKRSVGGVLLLILVTLIASSVAQQVLVYHSETRNQDRPNLILIVSDTLRADYCSLYGGSVPTPNLERLAARGVNFTNAHALAPWTYPSIWGIFNSQYPPGLTPNIDGDFWLAQLWQYANESENPNLPTLMQQEGYSTAAFTANMLLWVMPTAMSGFQTAASTHPILLRRDYPLIGYPFLSDFIAGAFPQWDSYRPHDTTIDIDSFARQWLQQKKTDPFFLYLHYIDPHAPYDPPAVYREQEGAWPFFHPYKGGERWGIPELEAKPYELSKEDQDYTRHLYEGEIRYMDEFVGRMLDYLEAEGHLDNTYICFTSDHGEELWDHGQWGHGQSLYEELLHVPLIFAGPGIAPATSDTPVSGLDLMPTLAGLTETPAQEDWRGVDLSPLLKGEVESLDLPPIFMQGTSNKTDHPRQAVMHEGYKLIRKAEHTHRELYHLESDPKEQKDLAQELPEKVQELDALLDEWQDTFKATFEYNPALDSDNEALQQLEGMGYL